MDELSDEELIVELRELVHEDFIDLSEEHINILYGFLASVILGPPITQEMIISIKEHFPRFSIVAQELFDYEFNGQEFDLQTLIEMVMSQ